MTKRLVGTFFVLMLFVMGFSGCNQEVDTGEAGPVPLGGSVSIAGSYNVDKPFVAVTSTVSGSGALTIQWLIGDAPGGDFHEITAGDGSLATIANITNVSFTPASGSAGKWLRVRATREGSTGSLTSLPYIILGDGVAPVITGVSITHPFSPSVLTVVKTEGPVQLTPEVSGNDVEDIQFVSWSIISAHAAGTSISETGLLTVGDDEAATTLTIRAASGFNAAWFADITAYISASNWANWEGVDPTGVPTVRTGANVYFVAADASAGGDGSFENPFQTVAQANTAVTPGGAVYIRGGSYTGFTANKAGTRGAPTLYAAYPPDLDPDNPNARGRPVFSGSISSSGSYIHLYGLDARGSISTNGGDHTTIEYCRAYGAAGVGINGGTNYSLILNCDVFQNVQWNNLPNNMNLDAFGMHTDTRGTRQGNVWYGNRAWASTDDCWDTIHCADIAVVERNWFSHSGWYYTEGSTYDDWTSGFDNMEIAKYNWGRGNGVKAGGWNMQNAMTGARQALAGTTQKVVRFNLAFGNANAGISTNFDWGGHYMTHNTSYNNNDNFDFMRRKGTNFSTANNNTQDSSRVINGTSIFATGNVAIPGGPINKGFNVGHLDWDSGLITNATRANGMQAPHGGYTERQIWNNSWEMVDNGASKSHGEANWIEGMMLHGWYDPAPDLWVGLPWTSEVEINGVTWWLKPPGQDGGTTFPSKDKVYFIQGASGPRGTVQAPELAWDHLGYWKYWDDKTNDIVQNSIGMTEADFMSFDEKQFFTPRKKNGDLPEIAFLRPVPGSVVDGLGYTAYDTTLTDRPWNPGTLTDISSGTWGYDPAILNDQIETVDTTAGSTSAIYRFYLWKYRAGANPTLDDSLNVVP